MSPKFKIMRSKLKVLSVSIFAAGLILAGSHVNGQESKSGGGTFRILQVGSIDDESLLTQGSIEESLPDEIKYDSKNGEIDVKVSSRRPAGPYPLPQSQTLELYRWLPVPPNAPEGTKPQKLILGRISLKNSAHQLVIIALGDDGSYPIRGLAINDLDEDHLPGQARLINLSSYRAAMALEGERAQGGPKTTDTIIQFAPGMTDIIVAIEVREGGRWTMALSRKLRLNSQLRIYTILYDYPPTPESPLPVRGTIITEPVRRTSLPAIRERGN